MTVLPDHEIEDLCRPHLDRFRDGAKPLVTPFVEERLQPASIDLTLSDEFRIPENGSTIAVDLGRPETYVSLTKQVNVATGEGFVLHPGEFVLASTVERVSLPAVIVARVEGKSSLGRLGLIVHATAGFIDPGFEGDITLEMTNLLRVPIILRPGLPICQISFSYMNAPPDKTYEGRYQGQRGVTESRYAG